VEEITQEWQERIQYCIHVSDKQERNVFRTKPSHHL